MNDPTESDRLARRNRELTILNRIASALNQEVDLSAALKSALERVAELLELRTGWIWLLHEADPSQAYLAAAQNLPPGLRDNPRRMEGSCYCLRTFQEGDLSGAANVNVVGCSRLAELVDGTDGLAYHASVPLYAPHGKKLGVLNVADTDWRELSAADLRLLYTIGDLLSIAVERGRLFERSTQIGAMEERNRLAREIHDTLGQNLAAITLHMETADALLEAGADTKEIWGIIQKALKLSRSGLQDARRSVLDLRAAPLEGRTLVEAVQALIDDFSLRNNADVELELAGTSRPLPTRIEVGAYRVIQEALANVEKHAQAKSVTIDLAITTRVLEITITDDGQGFQPEDIPEKRYGLVGMNERIYLMGGKLDLHSGPSVGTQLHITIPLQ